MIVLAALLALASPPPADEGFVFSFYAGEKAADSPLIVSRGGESACEGEIVQARVRTIPADDKALIGDLVHELREDGSVVRQWRVPLEAEPVGLNGDELLAVDTRSAERETYAFGTRGSIRLADPVEEPDREAFRECPANQLEESGYRWCLDLTDSSSKQQHIIEYQGPCT
ncbi:MAG TPA: hypothetical protein VJ806_11315 [Luteimonas sp.]|nr:hypothetical protein [Luteimonas sp.]